MAGAMRNTSVFGVHLSPLNNEPGFDVYQVPSPGWCRDRSIVSVLNLGIDLLVCLGRCDLVMPATVISFWWMPATNFHHMLFAVVKCFSFRTCPEELESSPLQIGEMFGSYAPLLEVGDYRGSTWVFRISISENHPVIQCHEPDRWDSCVRVLPGVIWQFGWINQAANMKATYLADEMDTLRVSNYWSC